MQKPSRFILKTSKLVLSVAAVLAFGCASSFAQNVTATTGAPDVGGLSFCCVA
jgi:hypothetical protein